VDLRQIVQRYYKAWIDHAGDVTGVVLAEDLTFLVALTLTGDATPLAGTVRAVGAGTVPEPR
jgi:ketosteroid isomerase-like protein